nr:MAG TPA: hypothetical protein [Caudoviricetes sp.]
MKIITQDGGTSLTDEEYKTLTALLVKMGYSVKVRKEKDGNYKSILKRVIYADEED